ncbi:MAG: hypothetical protein HRT66_06375 [Flavobacteriaceae bacterium]|nr:hypothetical protein [Flavobacteriaceae bacterium]
MTKRKKKSKKIKQTSSIKKIGYISLLFAPLFIFIYINGKKRKEKLINNSFTTYGTVEKLNKNTMKGKTTRKDVVYFYFVQNDTVFHKIKDLSKGVIAKLRIKNNDCFEMKVVKSDYGIFDINFNLKKDTIIDKTKYKTQMYNTFIHRNIIE